MTALLCDTRTDLTAQDHVRSVAEVTTVFGAQSQDSGNISYVVTDQGSIWFVKTAGCREVGAGEPMPYFDHEGRIFLLHNGIDVLSSVRHRAIPRLLHVVESATGPVLVQDYVPGELLHVSVAQRHLPQTAYQFVLGAQIDERTTVFNLSRLAWHFGTRLTESAATFLGGPESLAVLQRGYEPDPDDRWPDVAAFAAAWQESVA